MKPLEGIKVLDFTHMLSGPTCTNVFALLGAEVIKIERPGVGDPYRRYAGLKDLNAPFAVCNAGKHSVALDMKRPEAKDVIHRLAKAADIVVENFRPGATENLGIDWKSLRAINPRLIYCSISGFGRTGTLCDRSGLDQIAQAMSGMMWTGGKPTDGPVKVGFPVVDTFTGYMAAIAVLASLQRRHVTGDGEFIDVAMLDCSLKLMAGTVALALATGEPPERTGTRGYREVATADIYETAEGHLALGANQQHMFDSLCKVLGREDLSRDPRFTSYEARVKNSPALREILAKILRDRSASKLDAELAKAQVPAALVRDVFQITSDPHYQQREFLSKVGLPNQAGSLTLMGAGFELASGKLAPGAIPKVGEHTEQVMRSLGLDDAAIRKICGRLAE